MTVQKPASPAPAAKAAPPRPTWTKQSAAGMTPAAARVLLAGQAKVGKSTLAASWNPDRTLLIDTHQGTRLLTGEHYVRHVADWPQFVTVMDDVLADLAGPEATFDTIVVDLAEDVFRFCEFWIGDRKNLATGAQMEYGKGTTEAVALFQREIGRLLASTYGVWFISHTDTVKEEGQPTRYEPRLHAKIKDFVQGAVDYVLLAEANGPVRQIQTTPNAKFLVGFRRPMPPSLPLDARALWAAMDAGLNPKTAPAAVEQIATPQEVAA